MTHHRDLRICLLGGLEVVRRDGTTVSAESWRTGKTRDLLRLLALGNGQPVATDGLLAKLWPDVSAERARVSLRTASSQIRRAVGDSCVTRMPGSLVLEGAWVDTAEFNASARRVHAATQLGEHAETLDAARAAEQLYRGDFHAHDDDSGWARAEREHLIRTRLAVLCEGAAAALRLGEHREALELATAAARVDQDSELAHRALMRAYAELGDMGSALRIFETYRAHLARDLGTDPSDETRALHLRLLRGEVNDQGRASPADR